MAIRCAGAVAGPDVARRVGALARLGHGPARRHAGPASQPARPARGPAAHGRGAAGSRAGPAAGTTAASGPARRRDTRRAGRGCSPGGGDRVAPAATGRQPRRRRRGRRCRDPGSASPGRDNPHVPSRHDRRPQWRIPRSGPQPSGQPLDRFGPAASATVFRVGLGADGSVEIEANRPGATVPAASVPSPAGSVPQDRWTFLALRLAVGGPRGIASIGQLARRSTRGLDQPEFLRTRVVAGVGEELAAHRLH
jgi:hypothetical protein